MRVHKRVWMGVVTFLGIALLLAGCGTKTTAPPTTQAYPTSESQVTESPERKVTDMPEYTWSQLLSRDAIQPIYNPEFVPAGQAGYADDELVMGVAINGEAKAYPVGLLNSREMVDDELGGIPILVTW
jgi:hypothetical protein